MKSKLCDCERQHCCLTCTNYTGSIELIPTRLTGIGCKAPELKDAEISLHIGSWPKVDGKLIKKCQHWEG